MLAQVIFISDKAKLYYNEQKGSHKKNEKKIAYWGLTTLMQYGQIMYIILDNVTSEGSYGIHGGISSTIMTTVCSKG